MFTFGQLLTLNNVGHTAGVLGGGYILAFIFKRLEFDFYFGYWPARFHDEEERLHVAHEIQLARTQRDGARLFMRDARRQLRHHQIKPWKMIVYYFKFAFVVQNCRTQERLAKRFIGNSFYIAIPEIAKRVYQ